jgi:hypothetical protein
MKSSKNYSEAMREYTSPDSLNDETTRRGSTGLVVLIIVVAHAVFYFGPSLYLPFDLGELFVLGYALVIADSGLFVFFGIKLFARLLPGNGV